METDNTKSLGVVRVQNKVANENGLVGENGQIAPAAIITSQPTMQSATNGAQIELEEISHVGHEVGHTFMPNLDNSKSESKPGSGGLMTDPPGRIKPSEVDKIIKNSIPAAKKTD